MTQSGHDAAAVDRSAADDVSDAEIVDEDKDDVRLCWGRGGDGGAVVVGKKLAARPRCQSTSTPHLDPLPWEGRGNAIGVGQISGASRRV
jgi:hypothetical protein